MCHSMGYGVRKIEKFSGVDIIIQGEQTSESSTSDPSSVIFCSISVFCQF